MVCYVFILLVNKIQSLKVEREFLEMFKMFKEEAHQLLRNKIFLATQVIVLIMTAVQLGGLFINGGMSGATMALRLGSHNYIRYYVLALIFLILEEDFFKGTIEDKLTSGISRMSYFGAKLMIFGAFLALQIVISYIKDLLSGIIFGGFSFFSLDILGRLLFQWLVLWLFLFAISIVSFIIYELTKSVISSLVLAILLPLIINIVHIIIRLEGIFNYIDFVQVLSTIPAVTFAGLKEIASPLIGALVISIAGSLLAAVIFKHLDLQLFHYKRRDFFE